MVPARGSAPAVWPASVGRTKALPSAVRLAGGDIYFVIFSRASLSEPSRNGGASLGGTPVPARRPTPARRLARRGSCRYVKISVLETQYMKNKKKKFQFYARLSDFDIWLGGWVLNILKKLLPLFCNANQVVT